MCGQSSGEVNEVLTVCSAWNRNGAMTNPQEAPRLGIHCTVPSADRCAKLPARSSDPNISKLNNLCEARGFDVKDFAQHFDIRSKDPESLKDAVADFEQKAWIYDNHLQKSAAQ